MKILSERNLRATIIGFGGFMVAVSILADRIGLSHGVGVGFGQVVLALVGLLLLLLGIVWRNIPRAYTSLAIIILNTLVFLVLIEISALTWQWSREYVQSRQKQRRTAETLVENNNNDLVVLRRQMLYFQQQEWSDAMWAETEKLEFTSYLPFVIWRTQTTSGETVNADENHIRFTSDSDCDNEDAVVVFIFGGSSMWGSGVPDWLTIPSYLGRELGKILDGPICVVNYGERGYVLFQKIVTLQTQRVQMNLPDVVIFYDGINDTVVAGDQGITLSHFFIDSIQFNNPSGSEYVNTNSISQRERLFELIENTQSGQLAATYFRDTGSFVPDIPATVTSPVIGRSAHDLAEDFLQNYVESYHFIMALGDVYGFEPFVFWQPMAVTTRKIMTADEAFILESIRQSELVQEGQILADSQIAAIADDLSRMYDISHVLDNSDTTVFMDEVHLTHFGNEIVAQTMVNILTSEEIAD